MGKTVGSAVGDGEWRRETGDGYNGGNWRRVLPANATSLNFPSPQLDLTNHSSPLAERPLTLPLSWTQSVLAEMGDTCTNGTHPPEIQALTASSMSSSLQTTVSRVWPFARSSIRSRVGDDQKIQDHQASPT